MGRNRHVNIQKINQKRESSQSTIVWKHDNTKYIMWTQSIYFGTLNSLDHHSEYEFDNNSFWNLIWTLVQGCKHQILSRILQFIWLLYNMAHAMLKIANKNRIRVCFTKNTASLIVINTSSRNPTKSSNWIAKDNKH